MRFLPFVLFFMACGDESHARRDWRASDHTHPEGSQAQAPGQPEAAAPDDGQGRVRAAAALFRMECAPCHGAEGLGNGPSAQGLTVPSLATTAVQALDDASLVRVIAEGRGAMPAFGTRYTPDAVNALAEHVRTLAPH